MKKEKIFWGVLFILAGIFLIISKLGYFPNVNPFSLLLTALLIVVIVKSLIHLNFAGVLFPLAFICIIYNKELGLTSITPWTVLIAALFGSIGLSMIFTRHRCFDFKKHHRDHINHRNHKFEKIDVEDESHIKYSTSFGGSIKYINTDKFEQADFKCSFGSLKVYFDNAVMSGNNAVVNMDFSFSGIELYIPKSWKIEDKTDNVLSSVEEKNKNNQETTNTLTLVGNVNFSSVEIIYI